MAEDGREVGRARGRGGRSDDDVGHLAGELSEQKWGAGQRLQDGIEDDEIERGCEKEAYL